MKINIIKSVIAGLIAVLLTWGVCSMCLYDELTLTLGLVTFITLTAGGILAFGVDTDSRSMVSARIGAGIYFFIALAVNIVFCFIDFSIPVYVILSGVLLCIFLLVYLNIYRASKEVG